MEETEAILSEVIEGLLDGSSVTGDLLGPAGMAAASGAAFGARFHRIDRAEEDLSFDCAGKDFPVRLEKVLASRLKAFERNDQADKTVMAGTMGSGFFNLNPTACLVIFSQADKEATRVEIRTFAREGLINQKSAPKAAQKLKALLASAWPPSKPVRD